MHFTRVFLAGLFLLIAAGAWASDNCRTLDRFEEIRLFAGNRGADRPLDGSDIAILERMAGRLRGEPQAGQVTAMQELLSSSAALAKEGKSELALTLLRSDMYDSLITGMNMPFIACSTPAKAGSASSAAAPPPPRSAGTPSPQDTQRPQTMPLVIIAALVIGAVGLAFAPTSARSVFRRPEIDMADRRQDERYPCGLACAMALHGIDPVETTCFDISLGGCGVERVGDIEAEAGTTGSIKLLGTDRPFTVSWRGRTMLGLRFDERLVDEDLDAILARSRKAEQADEAA